jgi:hypothetical protein
MAVTEQRRHRLHQKLDEVVGVDDAATVMELLPPTGWADVARRDDLDRLETSLRREFGARFDAVDQRFDAVDQRFNALEYRIDDRMDGLRNELLAAFRGELVAAVSTQGRQLIMATLTGVFGVGGLAIALTQVMG